MCSHNETFAQFIKVKGLTPFGQAPSEAPVGLNIRPGGSLKTGCFDRSKCHCFMAALEVAPILLSFDLNSSIVFMPSFVNFFNSASVSV